MVRDDLQRFDCHEICWWFLSQEEAERLFNGILDGTRPRVFSAWCAECGGEVDGHGALLREGEDLEVGYMPPKCVGKRVRHRNCSSPE